MMLDITVAQPYFELIRLGKKKIEGRLAHPKFLNLIVGDFLLINNCLIATLQRLKHYPKFRDMLMKEGLENVLPSCRSIEEGEKIYYGFYSQENEKKFGVLALELKLKQITLH